MDENEIKRRPKPGAEDRASINRLFTPYLFFRRDREEIELECSSCNGRSLLPMIERTMTAEADELRTIAHNQSVTCPMCGRVCTAKQIGRVKNGATLWEEQRVALVLPEGHDRVWIMAWYAQKQYDRGRLDCRPEPSLNARAAYLLTPGESVKWSMHEGTYGGTRGFQTAKAATEPWPEAPSWWYPWAGYWMLGLERLDGTFLQYSQLDRMEAFWGRERKPGYVTGRPVQYLCEYAERPQMEILVKLGMERDIERMLETRVTYGRTLDWRGMTPQALFRLNGQELRSFLAKEPSVELLKLYQLGRRLGATMEEIRTYQAAMDAETEGFLRACKRYRLSPRRAYNRIGKRGAESIRLWTDYLDMAERLGYDMSDEVVTLPKRLSEAHDTAEGQLEIKEKPELALKMLRRAEKLEKEYGYAEDGYRICAPKSMAEIIKEGKVLSHCVGGYAERHAKGQATILFLRSEAEPAAPLYTIEVSKDSVRQAYGYRNKTTPDSDARTRTMFRHWKAYIRMTEAEKKAYLMEMKAEQAS